jgi:hypothetical protein
MQFTPADHSHEQLNNSADGYQSFGYVFPADSCFDYTQLNSLLSHLKAERIKGIFCTNQGWFIINSLKVPCTSISNTFLGCPKPVGSISKRSGLASTPCVRFNFAQKPLR